MKKITFLFIVVIANIMASFASDPGGMPGLVKATFKGSSFDSTSDVMANAQGCVVSPEEMYATSLPEKTTVAWAGYMKMEGGVTYDFKGCYDDFVTVKIAGTWILSKGSECQERTGSYTPATTDWYSIEFRVANNGGGGGCQNTSQYGILWKKSSDLDWRKVGAYDIEGSQLFKTGRSDLMAIYKTTPIVLLSQIRENDPTIMDVSYIVYSPHKTVNVRALAFEDGERSFLKVVRPETFVKDINGNETAQNIGDSIVANVEHKLSWKVSSDWKTDLAKVKFEILTSDMAQLPLKVQKIPAVGKYPALTVAYNEQSDADIFNALLWWYADGDAALVNKDGCINVKGIEWINRTNVNRAARMNILTWLYKKMGWEPLIGGNLLNYVRHATRMPLWWNSDSQTAVIKSDTKPSSLYISEKAYCVIDVSSGSNAEHFPVTYLDTEPVDGWGDEYKTTKIILRLISPGEYKMGGKCSVTLTRPFYICVYPITQRQYQLVCGQNPSITSVGFKYPVNNVSYNMIRGKDTGALWPVSSEVDEISFLGILRDKTLLRGVDLPTSAQYEYACKAGTTSLFHNGGASGTDFTLIGCKAIMPNASIVGSYFPNMWGLYDMIGVIFEWCRDWEGDFSADPEIDPLGPVNGVNRVVRPQSNAYISSISMRGINPDESRSSSSIAYGFRLVIE